MAKKVYSAKFDTYKDRYQRGGCTDAQLVRLVELRVLQDWEYKEITGKDLTD